MAHISESGVKTICEICDRYANEKTPLMMIINPAAGKGGYKKGLPESMKMLSEAGECRGVPCYLPPNAQGEDHLENFLGMMGVPMEPTPDFPKDIGDGKGLPIVTLTQHERAFLSECRGITTNSIANVASTNANWKALGPEPRVAPTIFDSFAKTTFAVERRRPASRSSVRTVKPLIVTVCAAVTVGQPASCASA